MYPSLIPYQNVSSENSHLGPQCILFYKSEVQVQLSLLPFFEDSFQLRGQASSMVL